jgi:adenosylcobinamide-GDP ribazoletransferase
MFKEIRVAFSFLTTLPVGRVEFDAREPVLPRAMFFFPLVGLVLGGLLLVSDRGLGALFTSPLLVAVLLVLLMAVLTGGLHLDGVADSADGLLSYRDRDKTLQIMRDSRIGAMGAEALFFTLALKIALFSALPPAGRGPVLLLTPLCGRIALIGMLSGLNYARSGPGMGTLFGRPPRLFLISMIALMAALSFSLLGAGFMLTMVLLWGGVVIGFMLLCFRRIGGYTGDTLGAICELSEMVPALASLIMWRGGSL